MSDNLSHSISVISNEVNVANEGVIPPDTSTINCAIADLPTSSVLIENDANVYPIIPTPAPKGKIPTMEWSGELEFAAVVVITKFCPYLATSGANKDAKWELCLKELHEMPEFRNAFDKCGVIVFIFIVY